MLFSGSRRTARPGMLALSACAAIVACSGLLACGGSSTAAQTAAQTKPHQACGPAGTATLASVYESVARRIYNGELRGNEVRLDVSRVSGYPQLSRALAASNRAGVYEAVHRIVYTPHWHIVRLRVLQKGHVLADVGGPDIIAPVSGALRWHGRTVGSFVTSVQDDIGYVKLVSRFTGVPIDLYRGGSLLMGTLASAPHSVHNGRSLTSGGRSYEERVLDALAFPSGTLQAVLFVPTASRALAGRSCADVRSSAWGQVARHIASRFSPLAANYPALVDTLQGSSGGFAYVREGSRRIAGGAAPASLPQSGTVRYRGRSWSVLSWEPVPPARVYLLTPPA
jgi:hypothetical protein